MNSDRIMPVDSLSYSAMMQLLRSPLIFKLKYVLGIYDGKRSMSSMIGSACHLALRFYYGGDKDRPVPADLVEARGIAMEVGLTFLTEYQDDYINYGKTGSREAMLKGYAQAMRFYWIEEPQYHEILACEEKVTANIVSDDGQEFPLSAVAIPDLVHKRPDGGIEAVDDKFVRTFTRYENEDGDPHEDYTKIVQAMFIYFVLKAKGIVIDRVLFREVKWSENKDGKPQIRDYAIPTDHQPYHVLFQNLYKDVVAYLSNNPIFLPNLSDPFDGEQAGLLYAQGLISADMSDVAITHKVVDVARVHKSFVASRLERAENSHLPPEQRVKVMLGEFGIPVEPAGVHVGPSVTQYRFKVSAGVRMATIQKHKNDIAGVLEAKGAVRILTPIEGTSLVGVEVENGKRDVVKLTPKYFETGLNLPIGLDVSGNVVRVPLGRAPHLLIGGTTGSGKSVLMHNIITGLTKQLTPDELDLTLIDPKRVELAAFAKKPHLHGKGVIFEHKAALRALLALTDAMDARYTLIEKAGKRDLDEFNASKRDPAKRLPYLVAVVDEFADLMLQSKRDEKKSSRPAYGSKTKVWLFKELKKRAKPLGYVEIPSDDDNTNLERRNIGTLGDWDKSQLIEVHEQLDSMDPTNGVALEPLVVRLAQMGRAAGIHVVLATQSPRVDVITGLIKANFPTRIALTTASAGDSKIILDVAGAEKLGGKGDMLYRFPGNKGDVRLQGFSN